MTKKAPTATEVTQSLTGFDEVVIKQKYGSPLTRLGQEDPTQFLRALTFILLRREEKTDAEAFGLSQSMTLAEVSAKFSPEPVEKDAESDFVTQPSKTTP